MPFQKRAKKDNQDKEKNKFLDMIRKAHINVSFIEILAHMSKYAKFFKNLISNKKRIDKFENITLNRECSALITNKLQLKLRHP